jgi:ketosteroid isomerase-like protein
MSKNVDVVRLAYASFARGDIPTVLGLLAADVEWVESQALGMPTRGTHRGQGAVAEKVFGTVPRDWETFALESEQVLEAGDFVVVTGRVRGRSKLGRVMDAPFAHLFTVVDGKIKKLVNYHDTALWLEALR